MFNFSACFLIWKAAGSSPYCEDLWGDSGASSSKPPLAYWAHMGLGLSLQEMAMPCVQPA